MSRCRPRHATRQLAHACAARRSGRRTASRRTASANLDQEAVLRRGRRRRSRESTSARAAGMRAQRGTRSGERSAVGARRAGAERSPAAWPASRPAARRGARARAPARPTVTSPPGADAHHRVLDLRGRQVEGVDERGALEDVVERRELVEVGVAEADRLRPPRDLDAEARRTRSPGRSPGTAARAPVRPRSARRAPSTRRSRASARPPAASRAARRRRRRRLARRHGSGIVGRRGAERAGYASCRVELTMPWMCPPAEASL